MPHRRQQLGRLGEELAAQEMTKSGLQVIEQNHQTREGEIDLIARDGDCLVFAEVRTRWGSTFGTPEESITERKRLRLIRLAEAYVGQNEWRGPWRIDFVGIHLSRQGQLEQINWITNAIEG
jgi:putative endonuclease